MTTEIVEKFVNDTPGLLDLMHRSPREFAGKAILGQRLTSEERAELRAIEKSANSAITNATMGLAAISDLIFASADSANDGCDLVDLSALIGLVGNVVEGANGARSEVAYILRKDLEIFAAGEKA